jgi:hypothetical protein
MEMEEKQMSYEILGSTGKWTCRQWDWRNYLNAAIVFGWHPEGAFFKNDEGGYGEHPSGSYFGNDYQIVTDNDARAMAAALNLAVATINAGSPMTDNQVMVLKEFKIDDGDPFWKHPGFTEEQRAFFLALEAKYLAEHPDELRTIHTRNGTFDINIRGMMDLAEVASAGSFTIS